MSNIDYVTVCYKNYALIGEQINFFERYLIDKNFKLIVVENTPLHERNQEQLNLFKQTTIPLEIIEVPNSYEGMFDGISHGVAIDIGLSISTAPIVCVFDSDFFFLKQDIHDYILKKFQEGYYTVGCEFNDGATASDWVRAYPDKFNRSAYFCGFFKSEVAKSDTWVINEQELAINRSNGYIEVGWRIRKYLIDNNIGQEKCLQWRAVETIRPTKFISEIGELVGVHIARGSFTSINQIKEILNTIQ